MQYEGQSVVSSLVFYVRSTLTFHFSPLWSYPASSEHPYSASNKIIYPLHKSTSDKTSTSRGIPADPAETRSYRDESWRPFLLRWRKEHGIDPVHSMLVNLWGNRSNLITRLSNTECQGIMGNYDYKTVSFPLLHSFIFTSGLLWCLVWLDYFDLI